MTGHYQIVLADLRERTRRFGFLATIGLAALLGYQIVAGVFHLRLGAYRGVLNSAWIGTLTALTLGFFLSLVGFFLVRGSVERDRSTGVGQVLASTRMSRIGYVVARFAANLIVLLTVVAVLAVAAAVMALLHAEVPGLDLGPLLAPLVVIAVPVAIVVAAVAVFFDCVPALRGSTGNVVYCALWLITLPFAGGGLLGFTAVEGAASATLRSGGFDAPGGIVLGVGEHDELTTFLWAGADWGTIAVGRLYLIVVATLLVAAAIVAFDRFASADARPTARLKRRRRTAAPAPPSPPAPPAPGSVASDEHRSGFLTEPVVRSSHPVACFAALVAGEFRLLIAGRSVFWYAGAATLVIAALVLPIDAVRILLPIAWIWPVVPWSESGGRARRHGVDALLGAAPSPVLRQLPAAWLSGVLLALAIGSGALVRFLAYPELLVGFAAGALFIPTLAIALGTAGAGERVFQVLAMVAWYLGPLNGVAPLDITGANYAALAAGVPIGYLAAVPVLLVATVASATARVTR